MTPPQKLTLFIVIPSPTLPRPEKDGTATGVDAVCTYHPDPLGPGLDREWLYRELSQLTNGITQLGPYTLDQDSLYVSGKKLPFFVCISSGPTFFLSIPPFSSSLSLLTLCFSTCAGYTHQTPATTPSSEYSEA